MSDGVKGSDLERENAFLSASSLFMLVYALERECVLGIGM